MALEFSFAVPTRISFGPHSVDDLPAAAANVGTRALIVSGHSSARAHGVMDRCISTLNDAGVHTTVFTGVSSNPTFDSILAAADAARSARADSIVAIGGGSVMDAARAVSLALARPDDFWECRVTGTLSVSGIPAQLIPVLTVPTVHGTGAEISPAMLLRRDCVKEVFFSPYLFPRHAFVDPSLACTVPPTKTAEVGVDAFIQGMEAFVSPQAQSFSDVFAMDAMRLAFHWLPVAYRDPADLAARSHVALAALLSLFAINQAGVGGIHALSTPLSARYDVHHGRALSLVAAAVVEHNRPAAPHRFSAVDRLLGGSAAESGADGTAALEAWLAGLGLGGRLADYGAQNADLDAMATEAQNPDMTTNPCELPPRTVRRIYESVM